MDDPTPTGRSRRSVLALSALALVPPALAAAGPAAAAPSALAWTEHPFTYNMQKPWDLPLSARYRNESGTHTMWVYDYDKPHTQDSNTDPRTEMRWLQEYSSGQHAWQGDVYIPTGVSGPSVMQILRVRGGDPGTPATDVMFDVHNQSGGTLRRYGSEVLATGIYNTWFRLRVEHTAVSGGTGSIKAYVNGTLKLTVADRGRATRHFKNGVYHHGSGRAEARFRNITYWRQ